mmetsp:Transcript_20420/g.43792  ORF Transcript_20420/g.43792 Transcript_20420/m.43792 type:complete len:473 (-) Transcript_20420:68-1486(-)|eukprot:CAMPEP_0172572116 /NCGR_PEP_ID=MMETSP1067-20121228/133866_1 /TAXON_ID=265564 ORGANISM="Thalassiosira punctigera, Strain Tpunct2005C2" /NCGR_SAMPLE_ID=MMETSP1067 /ASSEMBLY_ACC=CAM_ASM_000444 /LENGTH=472 /DNA_ID=CAMNT_0013364583 /DNA_START=193 /DNA_END=1611 /DNA_ORIENTATION=-
MHGTGVVWTGARSPRPPRRSSLNAYILAVAKAALKFVAGASVTTSTILALQLAWIVWRTPRLPPPPLSGADFARGGRVVRDYSDDDDNESRDDDGYNDQDDDDDDDCDFIGDIFPGDVLTEGIGTSYCLNKPTISNQSVARRKRKEFRLVLVGDSPVEGIGNVHHYHALGGQTARAFSNLVCRQKDYDCVRYWSYGKSGLTARGIEKEMVPFLLSVVDTIEKVGDSADNEASLETAIHAIIILCGVNNVLDPLSTTSSFRSEVRSLLTSIRGRPELERTPLIVLGLPDFARLPFLPWPLAFVLGIRGRRMQKELEMAVRELQQLEERRYGKTETISVSIPEVQDVIGSIGYLRHDSSGCSAGHGIEGFQIKTDRSERQRHPLPGYHYHNSASDTNDGTNDTQIESDKSEPLKMRLCHPILKYLGNVSLDQTELGQLTIEDFLCGDGFHPGGYGTTYIGNLIAESYEKFINLP